MFYCKCLNRNTVRVVFTLRLLGGGGGGVRGILLQVPKQKHCSSRFYSEAVGGRRGGGGPRYFTASA